MIRTAKNYTATTSLIISNLFPIFGVLFFHWNLANILILYWAETGVIGFYNILKMLFCPGTFSKLFQISFFIIHFGGFMLGHLLFLTVLFLGASSNSDGIPITSIMPALYLVFPSISYALFSMFVSHGISFVSNYLGNGEYKTASINVLFNQPYSRVIVMHITIIFGAMFTAVFGNRVMPLIILVAIKTAVDLNSHLRERRKFSRNR